MKSEIISFLFNHLSVILGFCLGLWLVGRILGRHLRPSVSLAWLMSIVLIPYIGVPAYFLFGGRKFERKMKRKIALYTRLPNELKTAEMDSLECIMLAAKMPPIRRGGSVELITHDLKAYETLLRLIDSAEESIHIVTFILGRDEVGRAIIEHLTAKAQQGVKVRLLLDALGCFRTRGGFVQPLRDAGGHVGIFMPVLPLRRKWSANLRNHRKMLIVDGRVAMVGGMNLARQYMGASSNPKRWLDSTLLVEGTATGDLEEIFAADWNFATEEPRWVHKFRRPLPAATSADPSMQIAASGPDVPDEPIHDAILTACMNAKNRIWIVTPYFIPDDSIEHAIMLQARLGRDVRILIPKRSDHFIADLARAPFLRRMKECGIRIFLYPGMIHAKHMIIDDDLALAGSMNLDMRSLYLNYEVGVFIRSPGDVSTVADWAQSVMERSGNYRKKSVGGVRAFLEDLSILVSPLL